MQTQQLRLAGKVVWIQMVSMRDKSTGKFNVMMDGNINNTLHTLASSIDEVEEFVWVLPILTESDKSIISDYNRYYFSGKITVFEMEYMYGINAVEHRELWSKIFDQDVHRKRIQDEWNHNAFRETFMSADTVVSDFPVESIANVSSPDSNLYFNFSLTKMSDDDQGPGTAYFGTELRLASHHKVDAVYLFSDKQYQYFVSKAIHDDKVFRRTQVFSKDFLDFVAKYVVTARFEIEDVEQVKSLIENVQASGKKLLLWPHRLDDPRYKLDQFLLDVGEEGLDETYVSILMTNPTNASEDFVLEKLNSMERCFVPIACLTPKDTYDKRYLYMSILLILTDECHVWHYEHDFHTGTAEQYLMLNDGLVLKSEELTEEVVKSYVTD